MTDVQDLDAWLDHVSEKVQRNVQIVTPQEVGQDFFLHLATDTRVRRFIPCLPLREQNPEARLIPRLVVAPTLLGCFISYAVSDSSFQAAKYKNTECPKWYGGWQIYAMPFQAALRPSARMVYDQLRSDEHWLVSYAPERSDFEAEPVGSAFYRAASSVETLDNEGTLFLEVTREGGFQFSKNIHLSPGYWRVEGPLAQNIADWLSDGTFVVTEIDESEFLSCKRAVPDLLHLQEKAPAYLAW